MRKFRRHKTSRKEKQCKINYGETIVSELPQPFANAVKLCDSAYEGEKPEDAEAVLSAARNCSEELMGEIERYSWGIIWTNEVQELLGKCFREIGNQRVIFDDLEKALGNMELLKIKKAKEDLEFSFKMLDEAWNELLSVKKVHFSPYGPIDIVIKASMNVLAGYLNPAPLAVLHVPAAVFVSRLAASVKRHEKFYGETENSKLAVKITEGLQLGVGALAKYLDTLDKVCLEDSLRLLRTSRQLHEVMERLGEEAAEKRERRHPLGEEFYRAKECKLSGHDLAMFRRAAATAVQSDVTAAQYLIEHPLCVLSGVDTEALKQAAVNAAECINSSLSKDWDDIDTEEIDNALADFSELIAQEMAKVTGDYEVVRGAAHFEELIVSVGLALAGKLAPEEFMAVLEYQNERLQEAAEEVNKSRAQMDPAEFVKLSQCFNVQAEALASMASWCDTGDPDELRGGWEYMASVLPEMRRLAADMRIRLQGGVQYTRETVCMKCGSANLKNARNCSVCGAVLPQVASANYAFTDMDGHDDSLQMTSGNLLRLENLMHDLEQGRAGENEIRSLLDDLLRNAENVKRVFENKLYPAIRKEGKGLGTAKQFSDDLASYISGLEMMAQYLEEPIDDYLYHGFDICRRALNSLQEVRGSLKRLGI